MRRRRLAALAGALALAGAPAALWLGGAFGGTAPALASGPDLAIRSVAFEPGAIALQVANAAGSPETIAVVTVDDAIVPFRCNGSETLGPGGATTVDVPFDWVSGDPYRIGVTSSHGHETSADVSAG